MKQITFAFLSAILFLGTAFAQSTGSIAGTVTDSNGSVIPNASVTIKGQSGQSYTVSTNEDGF
jgi:Carboxypeptidase regulatory-like domain